MKAVSKPKYKQNSAAVAKSLDITYIEITSVLLCLNCFYYQANLKLINSFKISKFWKQKLQTISMPNLFFTMLLARKRKQAAQISRMIHSVEILIVNTICIQGDMANIQIRETFFCGICRCDYNRWSWNYIKLCDLLSL